jgi:hypothetical protein
MSKTVTGVAFKHACCTETSQHIDCWRCGRHPSMFTQLPLPCLQAVASTQHCTVVTLIDADNSCVCHVHMQT